jgi:hypothetical protein
VSVIWVSICLLVLLVAMLLEVSFYGVEHVDGSGLASVFKEAFMAKFKEVSLHLYDATEQDKGMSLLGYSVWHQKNI